MTSATMRFEQAAAAVNDLNTRPGNLILLRLYALYKQAGTGDAQGERPGMTDFAARYKYDAWASLKGMPPEEAREQYVQLVGELIEADKT